MARLETVSGKITELGILRRRIDLKTTAKQSGNPLATASPIVPPRSRQTDLRGQASAAALSEFTKRIQPLLLNGCANANCHGRSTTTEFRLDKPPRGFHSTQRLTQRNLKSVLQQLDFVSPGKSALLTNARSAHGDQPAPLGMHKSKSFETLLSWVEMVAGPVVEPTAVPNRVATFASPGKFTARSVQSQTAKKSEVVEETAAVEPTHGELPPLSELGELPGPTTAKELPSGVDPFDANVFNETFGASK